MAKTAGMVKSALSTASTREADEKEAIARAATRQLPTMCQKTKMCRFHVTGNCFKGKACNFAHNSAEVKPVPDLFRTKLCPVLIDTGSCEDDRCTFAHNKEQLRNFPREGGDRRRRSTMSAKTAAVSTGLAVPEPLLPGMVVPGPVQVPPSQTWTLNGLALLQLGALKESSEMEASMTSCGSSEDADAASQSLSQQSTASEEVSSNGHTASAGSSAGSVSGTAEMSWAEATAHEGDSSRAEVEVPPEVPAAAPVRRNKFHKTKLCTFFLSGRCRKRGMCNFAHAEEEKNPLPDLLFTKLCPTLIDNGMCEDEGCTFAHSEAELRNPTAMPEKECRILSSHTSEASMSDFRTSTTAMGETLPSTPAESEVDEGEDERQSQAMSEDSLDEVPHLNFNRMQTEDPGLLVTRLLRVKNTFLDFTDEAEPAPLRRSNSLPALETMGLTTPKQETSRKHRRNSTVHGHGDGPAVEEAPASPQRQPSKTESEPSAMALPASLPPPWAQRAGAQTPPRVSSPPPRARAAIETCSPAPGAGVPILCR